MFKRKKQVEVVPIPNTGNFEKELPRTITHKYFTVKGDGTVKQIYINNTFLGEYYPAANIREPSAVIARYTTVHYDRFLNLDSAIDWLIKSREDNKERTRG